MTKRHGFAALSMTLKNDIVFVQFKIILLSSQKEEALQWKVMSLLKTTLKKF